MDSTKEDIQVVELLKQLNSYDYSSPVSNTGAYTGSIGTGLTEDTITLSSVYANTAITNNGVLAGGPYTVSTGITQPWFSNSATPKIKLDGEGADIEVNGWSLIDAIKKIEERLNILHPNEKLETEWEELRALGEQYRKLEQHIKDKQATWDKLKAMPPPEVY